MKDKCVEHCETTIPLSDETVEDQMETVEKMETVEDHDKEKLEGQMSILQSK